MNWWRLKIIHTETGGKIDVTYSDQDCVAGSRVPNPNACRQQPALLPGEVDAGGLHRPDPTASTSTSSQRHRDRPHRWRSPRVLTQYDYLGGPAWHYTDDDGMIKAEDKTWSVWRGYGGSGRQGRRRRADPHRDPVLPRHARRQAAVRHPQRDHARDRGRQRSRARRGRVRRHAPRGDHLQRARRRGGVRDRQRALAAPPTATRTINGDTVNARFTDIAAKHTRTALDGGRGTARPAR